MSDELITESEKQAISENAVNAWDKEREGSLAEPACSAYAWTVHWTSDDGMRPYHQDFTEAHEAGNWVRLLLEKGKTAVSVIKKE